MKYVIFSGIQPTGHITLGNYLGVIKGWKNYQIHNNIYNSYFTIADLHSITNGSPINLYNLVLDTLSIYLSCGIDYNKSTIFLQSQVSEHTKLHWILNSFTHVGELENMIQYKDKVITNNIITNKYKNAALLNYPILMASDILLYDTNYVPVGKDQKQHLELTKKIAIRFNNKYQKDIFKIPVPIFSENCDKIMSFTNPIQKMSKSAYNENSFISLLDTYEKIKKKIIISVTDNDNPSKIYYDKIKKPGISNLLNILSGLTNIDIKILENNFNNFMYKKFKIVVIENLYFHLQNIQKRFNHYRIQDNLLKMILLKGSEKASYKAKLMIRKINTIVGLLNINKTYNKN